jgi:hypothetical protein
MSTMMDTYLGAFSHRRGHSSSMPQTRSQTKFMSIKETHNDMDLPIASQSSTPSFRMVVPRIDRNDDRPLFEIVREYKFIPADTYSALVIHNDVQRAVNDIIRDGDFRIITWKVIHEQVSLMVPREIMLQHELEMDGYIQDSLRMTVWTGIPQRSLKQSDGQLDEDKTEPEKKKKKTKKNKKKTKKKKRKRKKRE